MNLQDTALACIARGWHVFPCWPETKQPMLKNGWHGASNDEQQVRAWWTRNPNANVAIACGPSNLCVVDIDHGLKDVEDFDAWCEHGPVLYTYAVRTGRRPEFGVQLYYTGTIPDVGLWKVDGKEGQVKSAGGYVMAAGSIHPDSKLPYEVICNIDPCEIPNRVRGWKTDKQAAPKDDGGPITANRNVTLTSIAGKLRNIPGMSIDALEVALLQMNADRCVPPLDEDEVKQIAKHAAVWSAPEIEPIPVLGSGKVTDWRELFHSKEDALNAPPVTFLIKDFLQREGVTAIAGPVRERKSIIALNVAHALVTGEKLFDYFEVLKKPERVLYLCPEVSLGPFTDRLKKIGLMEYVGETLFYRTLSADGTVSLNAPEIKPALPGSVVILDTAIRFLEGDENSSQDVRAFADSIFALLRDGAESVVMLHHSPKDSGESMTLENAMRGSGDMGAFLACCWGTKLQEPSKPYESPSFLSNLKQRDFESKDFEVTCGPDFRLHIVGDPAKRAVILQSRKGFKGNKDGMDSAAEAFIKANPEMPVRKLGEQLAALNINRGTTWISKTRARFQTEAGRPLMTG
jgi:hypothetical protein